MVNTCAEMSRTNDDDTRIVSWDNFNNWIHAICVVTFDLELGQAMETIYPLDRQLTEAERTNICYLAFPDSNSGLMGDVQFHFRIRRCSTARQYCDQKIVDAYNANCPIAIQTEEGFMYGYVYFRQVKDPSLRRGYFQKSVVILTDLPLVALFSSVVSLVAPEFFDSGDTSLEATGHHINQWPPPTPGASLCLPLLGSVLQVRIPDQQDKSGALSLDPPNTPPISGPHTVIIPSPHETEIFRILAPVVQYLNLLWELVLTAEPMVVMATSPAMAADTVHALVSMINPMKFGGDFRPFFTIHDPEFKEFTIRTSCAPNVILGVTNPFFTKALSHWPHVIRMGDGSGFSVNQKYKLPKMVALKRSMEQKPGVYTKNQPHLQSDKGLVKRLLKGAQTGRPVQVQSALLRRHLLELTQSFMIPLERYVASLMPLQKTICPYKSTPTLRPFNPDDFLSTLDSSGPHLTSGVKGDWEGLYRKFFRSVNFSIWFNGRHQEVSEKLAQLHLESLCEADMKDWVNTHSEVEVIDMVLRLRSKLSALNVSQSSEYEKLHSQLNVLMNSLPDDLKVVMMVS